MATKTFEKALSQLEKIVAELESGELPLEKSLKIFEDGIALSRYCSEKLEESEKKIQMLVKDSFQGVKEVPLDIQSDTEDEDIF